MVDLLFVYGTLRSGYENEWARRLRRESEFVGNVNVKGCVVPLGAYFGLIPGGDENVPGELYRLRDPEATLTALDEYEGPEYRRVTIPVSNGETAWAWRVAE
jgi:gamma-glutamylcyclotransferase (GGCT)/AIG2-like uncharacterized protein YtfP